MIVYDEPRSVEYRGRKRLSSHLASTLPGQAGTSELVEFAVRIGLNAWWIQKIGEPTEHFDLFDGAVARAERNGAAKIGRREFIYLVVWPKREWAKNAAV